MKNFRFNSPALHVFFVKNAIFFSIFKEKLFFMTNIYGLTQVKKTINIFGPKMSKS